MIVSIQQQHRLRGGSLKLARGSSLGSQDLLHACPAIEVVTWEAIYNGWDRSSNDFPFTPRCHFREPRVGGGEQCLDDAVIGELAVEELHREVQAWRLIRPPIAAPIRNHQIQAAIAIKVPDGNAIPPAGQRV